MTSSKANRAGRFTRAVLAAIAVGIPVIVVVGSVWSGTLWPFVPILIGGWIVLILVIRSVIVYKIYFGAFRKQQENARREIASLETRIEEVQRKSRDKN